MVKTYEEALKWLHNRTKFGIVPGLQRMEEMLIRLGNPHLSVKAIHVAGTNGKGSTITFLQNILLDAGYTVGTFSSPYILDYREQIMFCGEMISENEFTQLVNCMIPVVEEVEQLSCGAPTEFEIITTMAFYYFGKIKEHDIFLIEAGLGGLEDCTNVITPLISVITSIGHDHQQILGETIEEITKHKAGIIKYKIPVVTAELKENALKIIRNEANKNEADYFEYGKHFFASPLKDHSNEKFNFQVIGGFSIENVELSMLGQHQIRNASCAITVVQLLQNRYGMIFSETNIKSGLELSQKPGRLEKMAANPVVYIDGAHNVEGIKSLVETMNSHFRDKGIKILFSALKDKKVEEMVIELQKLTNNIEMTTFDFPRAMNKDELISNANNLNLTYEKDLYIAIDENIKNTHENEILLITGSLYFISVVRSYLLKKFV
ncbi:folylpolyglutamate synthase/dihydrofolate synthase family protein [Bacillus sp. AFS041924]|uniref:bifunctional folylpolyglutamate synthase/dihydrofolate synthase n=1 Tax=Bacillus sp. AFS041924 TaxID=2033503 RepID=UPI000BFC1BCC|nr:folylpolyglutamate synthase/dihydrofolate synthase family protein [Bacillus sp. AFS041924]PGS53175.1 bifunctional folylpolyglutamate synthase/dihydrofolate synthase [Bacillus sp. AFS041924]